MEVGVPRRGRQLLRPLPAVLDALRDPGAAAAAPVPAGVSGHPPQLQGKSPRRPVPSLRTVAVPASVWQDSSLPATVFVWTVDNLGSETRNVSVTFTFKNGNGTEEDKEGTQLLPARSVSQCHASLSLSVCDVTGGCWSEAFRGEAAVGTSIHQDIGGMACVYGVAGLAKVNRSLSRPRNVEDHSTCVLSAGRSGSVEDRPLRPVLRRQRTLARPRGRRASGPGGTRTQRRHR